MPPIPKPRRVLELLVTPGTVFEIRALNCHDGKRKPFTASGYFDDIEEAALEIQRIDAECYPDGIYWTLNPVDPACLARSSNSIIPYPEHTTTDKEILRRVYLPLDFDPVRPSGTSASESEVQQALAAMRQVQERGSIVPCDSRSSPCCW